MASLEKLSETSELPSEKEQSLRV